MSISPTRRGLGNLSVNDQQPSQLPEDQQDQDQVDAGREHGHVTLFRHMLAKQQDTIARLLEEQKKELYNKVEISSSKKHNLKQKPLEKQYELNNEHLQLTTRALSCVEKGYLDQARHCLDELEASLERHSEDLISYHC